MAAVLGIFAQRLQDEGGFADARIAADQQGRARHQPAAGDAVEFGDAGEAARRRRVFGFQVFQGECGGPLTRRVAPAPMGGATPSSVMVFQPPQASHLPDHLGVDGAAGLADKGGGGFGHANRVQQRRTIKCKDRHEPL